MMFFFKKKFKILENTTTFQTWNDTFHLETHVALQVQLVSGPLIRIALSWTKIAEATWIWEN